MNDCVFCKICEGKQEAELLYKDDALIVFRDINPKAPTHLLIVPRKHIKSVNELEDWDKELMGKIFLIAKEMAVKEGVSAEGYKLIINVGRGGGQIVEHLHLHLLGGKRFEE